MGLKQLFDIGVPLEEALVSTAIAPFAHRLSIPSRPVPMFGFTYADDDEDLKHLFEADHKIDFAKMKSVPEEDLDPIQQGDKVRYGGKPAIVKRMSFKAKHVDIVLAIGGQTIPLKLALK